jgi:16S rRNA (guanine966-N2)-methyltransferase
MRIVAGYLGGRTFESPHTKVTHPMSERVRGALFNSLGDIEGLSFLDAFAGSGGLSFEAMSRGAKSGVMIDTDHSAINACLESAEKLGLDKLEIYQANCYTWIVNHADQSFDLVFVDPPYGGYKEFSKIPNLAASLRKNGLMVVSTPPKNYALDQSMSAIKILKEITRNEYGDAELVFYRLIA